MVIHMGFFEVLGVVSDVVVGYVADRSMDELCNIINSDSIAICHEKKLASRVRKVVNGC